MGVHTKVNEVQHDCTREVVCNYELGTSFSAVVAVLRVDNFVHYLRNDRRQGSIQDFLLGGGGGGGGVGDIFIECA